MIKENIVFHWIREFEEENVTFIDIKTLLDAFFIPYHPGMIAAMTMQGHIRSINGHKAIALDALEYICKLN